MRSMNRRVMMATSSVFALFGQAALAQAPAPATCGGAPPGRPKCLDTDWTQFGGDLASTHAIPRWTRSMLPTCNKLELAWKFSTDALGPTPDAYFNSTPLIVKGASSPPPACGAMWYAWMAPPGELLWAYRHDEGARVGTRGGPGFGCSYWTDGTNERVILCHPRLTMISLDAEDGSCPIPLSA